MTDFRLSAPVRLFAPAKVNLGLEILERRPDGYHEVITLMETISLFDILDIEPWKELSIVSDKRIPARDDLTLKALEALQGYLERPLPIRVTVQKRIPMAAGLGGGSSDAGTLIGAIGSMTGLSNDEMWRIAGELGSDVPFFITGGAALAAGTGTSIESVPAKGRRWYVILVPELEIDGKTATLYGGLSEYDFSDGKETRALVEQLQRGELDETSSLINTFDRPLHEYRSFADAVDRLREAGATQIIASGAGPAAYAICDTFQHARLIRHGLEAEAGQVFIATSIGPNLNAIRLNR